MNPSTGIPQEVISKLEAIPKPKDVGQTALFISYVRFLESSKEENQRLFNDPFAKYFGGLQEITKFFNTQDFNKQIRQVLAMGVVLRTRFIDDQVMQHMIKGEIRQLVILGCGMDCRAFRFPFTSECHVFEIDTEQVNSYKNQVLEVVRNSSDLKPHLPSENRHVISMDFSNEGAPWKKPLLEAGFKKEQPTLWIMEGLLMYLTENDVVQLFEAVDELSAPKSKVVAQHRPPPPKEMPLSTALNAMGVNFKSSYSYEDFKILLEKFKFTNFTKFTSVDYGEWATKRLEQENLTAAEKRSGNYFALIEKN